MKISSENQNEEMFHRNINEEMAEMKIIGTSLGETSSGGIENNEKKKSLAAHGEEEKRISSAAEKALYNESPLNQRNRNEEAALTSLKSIQWRLRHRYMQNGGYVAKKGEAWNKMAKTRNLINRLITATSAKAGISYYGISTHREEKEKKPHNREKRRNQK